MWAHVSPFLFLLPILLSLPFFPPSLLPSPSFSLSPSLLCQDFDYTKSGSIGVDEFINLYHTLIYVRSVSGWSQTCGLGKVTSCSSISIPLSVCLPLSLPLPPSPRLARNSTHTVWTNRMSHSESCSTSSENSRRFAPITSPTWGTRLGFPPTLSLNPWLL